MSEVTVVDLENQKDQFKKLVELRDIADKLCRNRDFKKLILEEYMVNEAARLVQVSGDPNLTKDQKEDALAMAQATGHLKRYLQVVTQMGNHAESQIPNIDDEIAELRSMGDDE